MKSWTYAELTEKTEREIRDALNGPDKELGRTWAWGAYMLWHSLTSFEPGWTQEDDNRLANTIREFR
jgi:hypothetical protein